MAGNKPNSFNDIADPRVKDDLRRKITNLREAINQGSPGRIKTRTSILMSALRRLGVDPSTIPGAGSLLPMQPGPVSRGPSRPRAASKQVASVSARRDVKLLKSLSQRSDINSIPAPKLGRDTLVFYHVTDNTSAASILKDGVFKAGAANQFQGWESAVQGTYGWSTKERAEHALYQLALDIGEAGEFTVLKIEIPLSKFEDKLFPDEDFSLEKRDWRDSYKDAQAVAVKGDVPTTYVTEVHTDDKEVRRQAGVESKRRRPKSAPKPPAPGKTALASLPAVEDMNEQFFDALVRHQVGLLRFSAGVSTQARALLDETERDIAARIKRGLPSKAGTSVGKRRVDLLLKSLQSTRLKAWKEVDDLWVHNLQRLSTMEPDLVAGMLRTVSPVTLDLLTPDNSTLLALVRERPFEGRVLKDWSKSIAQADIDRIWGQVRIGVVQGEGSATIARRVVGTAALRGRDGVTEISRRNAESLTRTAVNAVGNSARREFYKANADLFKEELYVATLDGRTTPICRSLDGRRFPVGEGPIPPRHWGCRSLRTAVIDGQVIGQRPARPATERGLLREFTEQRKIRSISNRADLPRGTKGAYDQFRARRLREMTGQTPAKVSYQQWLNRQSPVFQDDVLGKTRAHLFRRGGLKLDKFVNRAGDQIPLSALARRHREAFKAAGLDPEDFL